jgi:YidC/Oxa1 family membrane protein insertase
LRAAAMIATLALFSSVAHALVEPKWIDQDVNKDGKVERVAVTNLTDIAFNDKGEIIGWYTKIIKGTDYNGQGSGFLGGLFGGGSSQTAPDPYNNKPSLVSTPSAIITALKGDAQTEKPKLSATPDLMEATFAYRQGAASVTKTYRIQPRRLTVDLEVTVNGLPRYDLEFVGLGGGKPQLKALEKGATTPLESGEVKDFVYASMQCCTSVLGSPGEAIIIRPDAGKGAIPAKIGTRIEKRTTDKGTEDVERSYISLNAPGNTTTKLHIYGGFNELVRLNLENLYPQLPGVFQPNIFGQLSLLLIQLLRFLNGIVGSWGLAIIALTILLRVAMWPLMQTQLKSSAEMQAIQPEVTKLREKFKDNPAKLQEATMALYKEHGVNPAAGCLPLFLQMPILIVLWRVVSNFEFDQGFLWLRDLSLPDTIPNGLFILPVLYVGVNVLQTYMLTRAQPEMFRTQLIVQLVFVYLVLSFPSGVTLYWVMSTIIQVGQQYLINRQIKAKMALKPIIVKPDTPPTTKKAASKK